MRIAQVSPLIEAVPPHRYGGTERVVSYLTEELISLGHDVTLFASGDSVTAAELIPACERALRLGQPKADHFPAHLLMLEKVIQRRSCFDVIHFHIDYIHYPWARRTPTATLTTLHGRLDLPELAPLYREFEDVPMVSISNAQRAPLPSQNWLGTVYHGLPEALLPFTPAPGTYLAFLGRLSPEKRADRAIEIARRTGIPLKIAGKVDRADIEYFEEAVAPLLRGNPMVEYVGEINQAQKAEFLGGALALLFPIDWPEPFGLVLIESLACGTPVVAFRHGSVPEIVDDGLTGFLVDDVDSAVNAVERITLIDRKSCRRVFETRFSAPRMANAYLALYGALLRSRSAESRPSLDPVT